MFWSKKPKPEAVYEECREFYASAVLTLTERLMEDLGAISRTNGTQKYREAERVINLFEKAATALPMVCSEAVEGVRDLRKDPAWSYRLNMLADTYIRTLESMANRKRQELLY